MKWRRTLRASLRVPYPFGQLRLLADMETVIRVNFLSVGSHLGLFAHLREKSASRSELVGRFGVANDEAFATFLDLGVALRELRVSRGRYSLRGRRARMLSRVRTDASAAMLQELVSYHGAVYRGLTELFTGAPAGDYLHTMASTVAQSSRILEPFTAAYLRDVVPADRPVRVLDVGCGSGTYLVMAAQVAAGATGLGVDVQPDAVAMSRRNLERAGVANRFSVRHADILAEPVDELFDVILLLNNVYYFDTADRQKLFQSLYDSLRENGKLVVTSMCYGETASALNFSLVLTGTEGCHRLPRVAELAGDLRASGFGTVRPEQLMPLEPYYGLVARRSAAR